MVKRCVIPDCSLEGDFSEFFRFPKDLKLLDQWISKLPLLNFTSLNFKEAEICEHHFNPKELKDGPGFRKELAKNAVPEYFPKQEEINFYSCRFCLRKIAGESYKIDTLIKSHYENLMQEDLNTDFPQSSCCEDCFHAIRNSSHVKSKIQENQLKLSQIGLQPEFLDIKLEVFQSDEDLEVKPLIEPKESLIKEEIDQISENPAPKPKTAKKKKKREKHSFSKQYCVLCKRDFSCLRRHIRRLHQEVLSYQCDLCPENFIMKNDIKNHMKIHEKYRNKNFVCNLCNNKEFVNRARYNTHVKKFHLKKDVIYCEYCFQEFPYYNGYLIHKRSHHTIDRSFKCDQCTMAYFSQTDLKKHIERAHTEESFPCEHCGKIYKTKDYLINHVRALHMERRYICDFPGCGKRFPVSNKLKIHRKIHFNMRDCVCKTCGMSFISNDRVLRHIRTVHMQVRYGCDIPGCKSQFGRKSKYRDHVLTRHQDIGPEQTQIILEKIRNTKVPDVENKYIV